MLAQRLSIALLAAVLTLGAAGVPENGSAPEPKGERTVEISDIGSNVFAIAALVKKGVALLDRALAKSSFMHISRSSLEATTEDLDYLYRTVYGEVRSQGSQEIEAVVDVIYNRWQSHHWGTSLRAVVLSPNQFSAWNRRDPNRKIVSSPKIYTMPSFDRVRSVCDFVVRNRRLGLIGDITNGSTHYFHPRSMVVRVVRRRGRTIRLGETPRWAHAFAFRTRIGAAWFLRRA